MKKFLAKYPGTPYICVCFLVLCIIGGMTAMYVYPDYADMSYVDPVIMRIDCYLLKIASVIMCAGLTAIGSAIYVEYFKKF